MLSNSGYSVAKFEQTVIFWDPQLITLFLSSSLPCTLMCFNPAPVHNIYVSSSISFTDLFLDRMRNPTHCPYLYCSQLLPHAASIVRFITKYFKACALPDLRIKVYSIAKTLLISMGVGMQKLLTKFLSAHSLPSGGALAAHYSLAIALWIKGLSFGGPNHSQIAALLPAPEEGLSKAQNTL